VLFRSAATSSGVAPEPPALRIRASRSPVKMSRSARVLYSLTCLALIALSLVGEFRMPLNADAAWLLSAAGRMLHGERLYVDILEINPPLIVWLNVPIAALSRLTGWSPGVVFRAAVVLAAVASIVGSVVLLSRRTSGAAEALTATALTIAFFPLVGGIFGQREHVALILILPYVAAVVRRAEGERLGWRSATVIGIGAGVGFAIKPHYVIVWMAIVAVRTICLRARRPLARPEDVAVLLVWAGYVTAVLCFTPDYFRLVAGSGRDYLAFGSHPLGYILLQDSPAIGWYFAIAAWWVLTRERRADRVGMLTAAAGAGFLAAVVAQHKGWSYHFYPVNACAFLLAVSTSVRTWPVLTNARAARLLTRALAGIFVALVACFVAVVLGAALGRARGPLPPRPSLQIALRTAVRRQPNAGSLAVLSSQIRDAQPLLLDSELESHPPYSTLWVPLTYYRSYAGTSDRVGYRSPAEMSPGERDAFDRIVRQLVTRPPDILVVESRALNERRTKYPGGFDFLAYFGQDPRFGSILPSYAQVDNVGGLLILRRAHRGVGAG